jgi:predicted TPR repeat methyltransferase
MLSAANTNGAIAVFQANAMVFARSANVFDSLGEALERAGKRDAAVTAYRQALALDAKLASSRDALQRLGASP